MNTSPIKTVKSTDFPIVGLGASAGGLEALEAFFSNMPFDKGVAFVVIQHLSPRHKSMMASILSKSTEMNIFEIEDGMDIEPNCIYLNPPDKNIVIQKGELHTIPPIPSNRLNLPIDCFFKSMAEDLKEKAICVILSGTATDGTLGLKAVKGAGGMTMVQEPDSAQYDGMPNSAISTGIVDFILPADQLPSALVKYITTPYIATRKKFDIDSKVLPVLNKRIFSLIRQSTGHDLSHYKQTTILRRIERRMAVQQIKTISSYIEYLEKTPTEVDILFRDMLIGVTSFFRDTEVFKMLKEQVIPELLKDKQPESLLRIWVVGCSTGEEAYSLAIIFLEVMDLIKQHCSIQVFASDIDADAIESARSGLYPASIAADISKERLDKYFVKDGDTYRIKKQIRDMIVFAIQNVTKDPPFSRIDLVSCRNLLIYMDSSLQKRILPLFHYTLKSNGIMVLGTSESIGEFSNLFIPFSNKCNIFKKQDGLITKPVDYTAMPFYYSHTGNTHSEKAMMDVDVPRIAEKVILNEYASPGVLVNKHDEIVHFLGKTDKFLETPVGKASFNVLSMAREGLRFKLNSALQNARKQKKTISCTDVQIKHNEKTQIIDFTVRPLLEAGATSEFLLLMFNDKNQLSQTKEKKSIKKREGKSDPALDILRRELDITREQLQTTIEERETSNEELKSTNEELQSVNEELQSTNEELETSKEELQSTNEELVTVNTELQKNVDELSEANNDINNLLASTDIGTIFLDIDLKIKRFTPAATNLFNLIDTDVGRSIRDITSNFLFENIYDDMQHVLKTLEKTMNELQNKDGEWYSVQIVPYRTIHNVIDGVVTTFTNVTKIKQTEQKLRTLATVVQDSNDAITLQNFDGKITAWNKGAELMYGYSESEALKMNILDIVPTDKKAETNAFMKRIQKENVKSFKTERQTKKGALLKVWLTVTKLVDEHGNPIGIATTERNISEIESLLNKKQESSS